MPWKPLKILVEREVAQTAVAATVLARWPDVNAISVDRVKDYSKHLNSDYLAVAKQRGRFIKKCPGTPAYSCCNYYILNLGIGCRFNCTYCYLHHYMNSPFTVFANTDDLISQARELFGRDPRRHFRVGSGEFIDSVDFDEITGVHKQLVPALTALPNLVFEIKTKSTRINHLLDLDHHGRAVVSWSINPERVWETEEHLTAPYEARLAAAALAVDAGYRVGFHFDPLIHYSDWAADYASVVHDIFEHVAPEDIAWISLGALRFNPSLKPIIERKFPHSELTAGELVRGLDGKLRYFIAIRRRMFRHLNQEISKYGDQIPVYLCMENRELAEAVGVTGLRA